MFSTTEYDRAMRLLHGSDEYRSSIPDNDALSVLKNFLPHIALTVVIAFLFLLRLLIPLVVLLAVLLFFKAKSSFGLQKKALDFEKDFATFLVSLAASLRCGNEPLSALFNAREMFAEESAVTQAIVKAKEEAEAGRNESAVISGFAADIKHPELALFRSAFLLARSEGASLSFSLERLAKVIRTRQSIRRKIKTAVTMQKLSAYGICSAVLGLLIFQLVTAKDLLLQAWNHTLGEKLLLMAGMMIICGFVWMLCLTRSRL